MGGEPRNTETKTANHAMQRSRACKVFQMECQSSRLADRRRYRTDVGTRNGFATSFASVDWLLSNILRPFNVGPFGLRCQESLVQIVRPADISRMLRVKRRETDARWFYNWPLLMVYRDHARRMAKRHLSRRSQHSYLNWQKFNAFLEQNPLASRNA